MKLQYEINDENLNNKPIKYILKNKLELSERLINKLKFSHNIFLNGIAIFTNALVKTGDIVEAIINFEEDIENIIPEDIDIDIIHEDECIIAINKKHGIVIHPTYNYPSGTMANALRHYYDKKNIKKTIRPVSRLDRDTSGVVIFAKNEYVQEHLVRQMKTKTFVKEYLGIVQGKLKEKSGTINLPIARDPNSIILRCVSEDGSPSVTHFNVLSEFNGASLVRFIPVTGRTHQIRVHSSSIGHPLLGDTLYSDLTTSLIDRQALHSHKVSFIHPLVGSNIKLTAPIPQDMENLLLILKKT